jgi:hypothetical protein
MAAELAVFCGGYYKLATSRQQHMFRQSQRRRIDNVGSFKTSDGQYDFDLRRILACAVG